MDLETIMNINKLRSDIKRLDNRIDYLLTMMIIHLKYQHRMTELPEVPFANSVEKQVLENMKNDKVGDQDV